MDKATEDFIEEYVASIRENNAAIFAGAGLSIPVGYVDWKSLLREIASDIGLNVDKETDLVAVAQYHVNKKSRHKIHNEILNHFTVKAKESENHRIIASLPIRTVWTTNYDSVLEDTYDKAGKVVDKKFKSDHLPLTKRNRDVILYKMHGDASDPSSAVLTRDDYESYQEERGMFSTALQGDLVSKTFLFLGFSFTDPNINYILSRVRVLVGQENQRKHYCIMRKVDKKKYSASDYRYAVTQMEHYSADLKRYGIETVWVNDYSDITLILKEIKRRFRRYRVLISGSAELYSETWGDDRSKKFIHDLAFKVLEAGFDVASGFGVGVGSAVINGALDYKEKYSAGVFEDRLILRPFPQFQTKDKTLPELWKNYREEMIKDVGVAIFIFGNKKSNDEIVNADGVRREFEIAKKLGVKVIPVGATGWMSKELWDEVWANYEEYFGDISGVKALVNEIGQSTQPPSKVISKILKILSKLSQE